MNEKSISFQEQFCKKCEKITRHKVQRANLLAGRTKTLRKSTVVKTVCCECGFKTMFPGTVKS